MNPNPPPPPPPSSFPVETTTWWQRNKKWALPVGCVGLFVILGCCGALGAVMYAGKAGLDMFKDAAVKMVPIEQEVRARAEQSPELQEALGSPIVVGERTGYNVGVHNGEVKIAFSYRVSGPAGQTVVSGEARAPDSKSSLALRVLEAEVGDRTIDLMDGPPPQMREAPMDAPEDAPMEDSMGEPMEDAPTE